MNSISREWVLVLLLLTTLWLTGCDGGSSLSAEITRGESKWQTQGIPSYVIEVSHGSGTWHYQTHTITVQNGEVIDASATCVDAPMETALGQKCEVQAYDPEDYTVLGLFKLAWAHFEVFPTENLEIEFDPAYGFPTTIRYDDPDIVDDDQYWGVRSFEIYEENEGSYLRVKTSRAESLWKSHGLQNYFLEVGHASGLWHYQIHYITVRNGVVVDAYANCFDTPMDTALEKNCEVEPFRTDEYTVSGLFRLAYQLLEKYPQESLYLEFDPEYGYPATIRYDDPEMVDEEQAWGVKSFEIIKE